MSRAGGRPWWVVLVAVALGALSVIAKQQGWISAEPSVIETPPSAPDAPPAADPPRSTEGASSNDTPRPDVPLPASADNAALLRAIREKRSNVIVEASAEVIKILPDDNDGARHQRFLVLVAPGKTVLIAHNVDLSRRLPLEEGDEVRFEGEFEWNAKGGVIHWTHRDPANRHAHGWIEHEGEVYE